MSMFVVNEGVLLTFSEFLMLESLGPAPVDYGTNDPALDNKEALRGDRYSATFFKANDLFYSVLIMDHGEIGFGVSDEFSTDMNAYGDDRRKTFSALKVLNAFIYITLELAAAKKLQRLQFSAASEGLGYIYDGIMRNSVFLQKMQSAGWEYRGKQGQHHIFTQTV